MDEIFIDITTQIIIVIIWHCVTIQRRKWDTNSLDTVW